MHNMTAIMNAKKEGRAEEHKADIDKLATYFLENNMASSREEAFKMAVNALGEQY